MIFLYLLTMKSVPYIAHYLDLMSILVMENIAIFYHGYRLLARKEWLKMSWECLPALNPPIHAKLTIIGTKPPSD